MRNGSFYQQPAVSGGTPTGAPKLKLLDRVRQAIRARHDSQRTGAGYVGWIRRLAVGFPGPDARLRCAGAPSAAASLIRNGGAKGHEASRAARWDRQSRDPSSLATRLGHAPSGRWGRHPDRLRALGSSGSQHDHDLHARMKSRRPWGSPSGRRFVRESNGVLYRNHITPRRNLRNRLSSLAAQNLRTNAHQRLRPTESGLRVMCRNHIINS